jgi:hypothetical protein
MLGSPKPLLAHFGHCTMSEPSPLDQRRTRTDLVEQRSSANLFHCGPAGAKAKSWELRTATGLARPWCDEDKLQQAKDVLLPVYGWSTQNRTTRPMTINEHSLYSKEPEQRFDLTAQHALIEPRSA